MADGRVSLEVREGDPHRFRLELASSTDAEAIASVFRDPGREVEYDIGSVGERTWVDLVVQFSPRTAAVFRQVNRLRRAGIGVHDFMPLDTVDDPPDEWLRESVDLWRRTKNKGDGRRRLEACAGVEVIEALSDWLDTDDGDVAFAMGQAAFNTPGAQAYESLVTAAAEHAGKGKSGRWRAYRLLNHAWDHAKLAALLARYTNATFGEGDLPELIKSKAWDVQSAAIRCIGEAPGVLSEDAVDRLIAVLSAGGTNAPEAAYALGKAAPSDRVQNALRAAFAEGAPAVRRPAGGSYCEVWGEEGRFVWLDLLGRPHVEDRSNGRALLAAYGTAEDLPLAAEELKRILATRTKRSYVPPLGSELIKFLVRHHDQDEAAEALRDLISRRSATANELVAWVQTQHPDVLGE